ncbi:MAG TPA: OB-fold domain-containing protein [Acidimicrobiales bacterium]|nr:OB-fold domain-containing protein [Acidimicrobiales bacterium]
MNEPERAIPAPVADPESAPFWAALADGRVIVQECVECGRRRFPRLPACPFCGAPGGADVEIPGTGRVYSFVRVNRALNPVMAADVPYCIATVDMDGGGRMQGRLEPASAAGIDLAVAPVFFSHPDWTELRFRPASEERPT